MRHHTHLSCQILILWSGLDTQDLTQCQINNQTFFRMKTQTFHIKCLGFASLMLESGSGWWVMPAKFKSWWRWFRRGCYPFLQCISVNSFFSSVMITVSKCDAKQQQPPSCWESVTLPIQLGILSGMPVLRGSMRAIQIQNKCKYKCKYKYKYKYRWSPEWDACLRFNVLLIGRCSQTFTQVADYSIWRGMQMQKLILSVESVVQSWTTFLLQCNVEQTRVERMLKRLTWVLNLLFCFYLHLHLYLYLYLYLD